MHAYMQRIPNYFKGLSCALQKHATRMKGAIFQILVEILVPQTAAILCYFACIQASARNNPRRCGKLPCPQNMSIVIMPMPCLYETLMHLSIASPAPGDPGIAGIRAGTYKLPM